MSNTLKNQKGFTLIEIIAVLIILGILAAVAVPKYLDLTAEAKKKAAVAEVAEMKSSLNLAYAKYFIRTDGPPTGTLAITELGATSGTAFTVGTTPDDWSVKLTATDDVVAIAVISRGGATDYNATGTWNVP